MTDSPSKIPSGIRYYFGSEARLRRAIEQTAMSVFGGWSYEEIITPALDYYTLFERGMGPQEATRAFKFSDSDGQLLALRPDVTSGIARAAATLMARRERPLRFCYAAPVFRLAAESHAEWRRESTQIGCELIGQNSTNADLEMLMIVSEVLTRLGFANGFTITLNDLEIFTGVVESLDLDSRAREEMRQLIDTRNAVDLKRFLEGRGAADEIEAIAALVVLSGKKEVFPKARTVISNLRSAAALDRLEKLWEVIAALNLTDRFEIDFGDLSRLDYYTGLIFKVYVPGAGTRAGSGGRYDQLTANFGRAEPAVGFVLELDVLADAILAAGNSFSDSRPENVPSRLAAGESIDLFRSALQHRSRDQRVVVSRKETA
jgi:ATP phosphoribosyltransferase regulatory subunit